MIRSTIFTMAALLMAGVAFTACSSEEEVTNVAPDGQTFSVCIPATKGIDADTRTLIWGEHSLNTEWSTSDKIYVVKGNEVGGIDANVLTPDKNGPAANLVGGLAGTYEVGDELKLVLGFYDLGKSVYHWLNYSIITKSQIEIITQNGTKETVEYFDYASAIVEVTAVDGGKVTTTPASFTPCQSIYKFTFTDGTNPVKAIDVKISSKKDKIVSICNIVEGTETKLGDFPLELYLDSPSSEIYVALRMDESVTDADEILFEVEDEEGYIYKGTKTATADMPVNGKYYAATVTLTYTGVQNTFKIEPAENYTQSSSTGTYQIKGDATISGSKDMVDKDISIGTGLTVTFKGLSLTGGMVDFNRGSNQTIILDGTNTIKDMFLLLYRVKNLTFKGNGSLEGFKVDDRDKELLKNGTMTYDIDGEIVTATVNYEDGLEFIDNGDGTYSIK